jgi:hypothetical protein
MCLKLHLSQSEEVTGCRRELRNEDLHDLYSYPYVIRVIKLRRMSWAGMWHACERREIRTFCFENFKERDHLGDMGVNERIILK